MSAPLHVELAAPCGRWHMRAAEFMAEASRTANSRDIVRLTAMASTLDFAARDLSCVITTRPPHSPSADHNRGDETS